MADIKTKKSNINWEELKYDQEVYLVSPKKWMHKLFQIHDNCKVEFFVKKYYLKNNLEKVRLTFFNSQQITDISPEVIRKSIKNFLTRQKISITHYDVELKIGSSIKRLNQMAEKLGWDNSQFLWQKIISYCHGTWIQKSILLVAPQKFKLSYQI